MVSRVIHIGVVIGLATAAFGVTRAPGAGAAEKAVRVVDRAFIPPNVTVERDDTVTWRHEGKESHTVTFDDGSFDSGQNCLSPVLRCTASGSRSFTQPGTYHYHCKIHPQQMRGTVTVSSSRTPSPKPAPSPRRPSSPSPASRSPAASPAPSRSPAASPAPSRSPAAAPSPARSPVASPLPASAIASPDPSSAAPLAPFSSPDPTRLPVATPTPSPARSPSVQAARPKPEGGPSTPGVVAAVAGLTALASAGGLLWLRRLGS